MGCSTTNNPTEIGSGKDPAREEFLCATIHRNIYFKYVCFDRVIFSLPSIVDFKKRGFFLRF
jgi:hypothetical protein